MAGFLSARRGEEKKRTTHILETVLRVRPSSNDGRHARAFSEGTYSHELQLQMSQQPRSCSSTSALKEAAEEVLQDKDSLLQQGLLHQHPLSGRRASAHDNRPLPQITGRRQPMVSPPPNHSSISFPGVPDDPGETQGPPKSPPARVLGEPGGDDTSRRRPSSAKEGGITRNKSPPDCQARQRVHTIRLSKEAEITCVPPLVNHLLAYS